MKKAAILVVLVVAAAIAWIVVRNPAAGPPSAANRAGLRADTQARSSAHHPGQERPDPPLPKVAKRRKVSKAERDALHRLILASRSRREAKQSTTAIRCDGPTEADDPQRDPIENRLGDDDPWNALATDLLTNDFGPLADECFELAKERNPELGGMAAIVFTVVADEDLGGVVETAEAADDNEIEDAGFVECMQETMLTTIFPPPSTSTPSGLVSRGGRRAKDCPGPAP